MGRLIYKIVANPCTYLLLVKTISLFRKIPETSQARSCI